MSSLRYRVFKGTKTPPTLATAYIKKSHSGLLFIQRATFSPGSTPREIRPFAAAETPASNSNHVHLLSPKTSASRFPHFFAASLVVWPNVLFSNHSDIFCCPFVVLD